MSKISKLKEKLKKMGYTDGLISVYIKVLIASGHTYIGDEQGETSLGVDFISSGKIKPNYGKKPNEISLYGEDWDGCLDTFAHVKDPIDPSSMGYSSCERSKITIACITEDLGIIATSAYPDGLNLSSATIRYYSSQKWRDFLVNHEGTSLFDVVLDSTYTPNQTVELDRPISYGVPFKGDRMSKILHDALQKRRKKEKTS